jgi:hypothetical protein
MIRDRYRYYNTGIEYRKYREKSERYSIPVFSTGKKAERYSIPVFSTGIQYREKSEQYSIPVFSTGKNQSGIEYRY